MNLHLTPDLEQIIREKADSERYQSTDKVIRTALHLLVKRDLILDDVRQQIQKGWDSAEAGNLVDGEEFMEQMLAELHEEILREEAYTADQLVAAN